MMPRAIEPDVWIGRARHLGFEWLEVPGSRRSVCPARCLTCGYEWSCQPGGLARGSSCPECAYEKARTPHEEWDRRAAAAGLEMVEYPPNSGKKTLVRCAHCGDEFMAWPIRITAGKGCQHCDPNVARVSREEWDRRAALVGIEWLEDPKAGNDAFEARCLKCGYEYKAYSAGVYSGRGCKKCSARAQRLDPGDWDRRAALVGIDWLSHPETKRSKTPARCRKCGYEWLASPSNVSIGHGCPQCGGRLPITRAVWDERAKAVGIRWLTEPRQSLEKASAECVTCGYQWDVLPSKIQGGSGCPSCAERIPVTREEWDRRIAVCGMEWIEYPGRSSVQGIARCPSCGYIGPKYAQAASRGAGCPVCTDPSFDPEAPSLVYLITLPDAGLMKIGKTNAAAKNDRLQVHRRRGWEVVQVWNTRAGAQASAIEREVIDYWRSRGVNAVNAEDVPERDGYTETVRIGRVDIPETMRLVDASVAQLC